MLSSKHLKSTFYARTAFVLFAGTVSIMFILTSVLYRCWGWGINADFSDVNSEDYIPLFRSNFPSLTGEQRTLSEKSQ